MNRIATGRCIYTCIYTLSLYFIHSFPPSHFPAHPAFWWLYISMDSWISLLRLLNLLDIKDWSLAIVSKPILMVTMCVLLNAKCSFKII